MLAWVGLVFGVAALFAIPAWWLASRPEHAAGSFPALARVVEPAGEPSARAREPGHPDLGQGTGAPVVPGFPTALHPRRWERVAVRSALLDDLERPLAARPVSLRIPSLDVDAPIVPAGVDSRTREMQVPGDGTTVGWYRHGPSPGQPGSAVLAGHVDYGGARAVFYELARLEPGAVVVVAFGNASERRFQVVARRLYGKDQLPPRVFTREGRPILTLITCGGGYEASTRSYDGNVVVYAVPAGGKDV